MSWTGQDKSCRWDPGGRPPDVIRGPSLVELARLASAVLNGTRDWLPLAAGKDAQQQDGPHHQ
jgi:hypothetical protein